VASNFGDMSTAFNGGLYGKASDRPF
jgi:hypothetical protein